MMATGSLLAARMAMTLAWTNVLVYTVETKKKLKSLTLFMHLNVLLLGIVCATYT